MKKKNTFELRNLYGGMDLAYEIHITCCKNTHKANEMGQNSAVLTQWLFVCFCGVYATHTQKKKKSECIFFLNVDGRLMYVAFLIWMAFLLARDIHNTPLSQLAHYWLEIFWMEITCERWCSTTFLSVIKVSSTP